MGTKIEDDTSGLGLRYEEAVCEMGTYFIERLTRCWLHFEWVFKLSPLGINHGKMLKVIREFPNKIINQRKQYREKYGDDFFIHGANDGELFMNKRKKIVMLDLLLNAEKENKIDRKGIQEEVDTFMFGVTIIYCTLFMCKKKHCYTFQIILIYYFARFIKISTRVLKLNIILT